MKVWSIQIDGTFFDGTMGKIVHSLADGDRGPAAEAHSDELRDELLVALDNALIGLDAAGFQVDGLLETTPAMGALA